MGVVFLKYRAPRRRSPRGRLRLLLVLCLAGYMAVSWLLAPRAAQLAEVEIRRSALEAIHRAAEALLGEYDGSYGEIGLRENGTVAFVQTDTQQLAQLQSRLCTQIAEELSSMGRVSVRLGSLTPVTVFSGKGPKIHLRLEQEGTAEVSFENEFVSAGVNQTLHRIRMDVTVHITVRALWYTRPQTVQASFVLGETVIVGEVPGGLYAVPEP